MNIFFILAFVALLATVVTMVMGIRSMTHGGEEDQEASTRLMFRRVEFQAAALALILAGIFLAGGWIGGTPTAPGERLTVDLGVLPATQIRAQYGEDSPEAQAYGGVPDAEDAYLVTIALTDRDTGERVEDATVTATVGQLGLSGATRELRPSRFAGALTYGNYFRMPKADTYRVDIMVDRPDVTGTDLVRLQYHRP